MTPGKKYGYTVYASCNGILPDLSALRLPGISLKDNFGYSIATMKISELRSTRDINEELLCTLSIILPGY